MVKAVIMCLGAGMMTILPIVASAYYEESLSAGSASEIEIISQPSTVSQVETKAVESKELETKNLPEVQPVPQVQAQRIPAASKPVTINQGKPGLVSFVGTGKPINVSGKAKGLPLSLTVPMITPKGWRINFDPAVSDRRVTFNAKGRPWTLILEEMANSTNTMMLVDWQKGHVNVGSNVAISEPLPITTPFKGGIVRKAIIGKAGTAREVAQRYKLDPIKFCAWNQVGTNAWLADGYEVYLEEPPAGTIVVANITASPNDPYIGSGKKYVLPETSQSLPVQQIAPVSVAQPAHPVSAPAGPENSTAPVSEPSAEAFCFSLRPGTLSSQLNEWCVRAGYSLVWKIDDDYEITSFSAFGSDFQKSLVALFQSLMESGEPLRATVYERNHIVEVTSE